MKVLCKKNNPDDVKSGVPDNFNFGIELDKEYLVMGMMLTERQLWYMIDEGGTPNFYPYQLFEVIEASIRADWYFKLYSKDDGIYPFAKEAIWGYYELCFDENHYEQLVDREPEALRLYFRRKIELEKELAE